MTDNSISGETASDRNTLAGTKHLLLREHVSEGTFEAKHLSVLTEILADCSSKWKVIGIALNLPSNTLKNISAMMHADDPNVCLYKVLKEWVGGQHVDAKPATLDSLKQALLSRTVELGDKAHELAANLAQCGVFKDETQACAKRPCLQTENLLHINRPLPIVKAAKKSSAACSILDSSKCQVDLSIHRKILVDIYSLEPEVPKDSWPPVSGQTFINLALINQHGASNASKYVRSTIQGDMDDIMNDKKSTCYEDVFRDFQSKSLVLIEGRPGSGKTTLVHKISQDWANGKQILKGAKLVFLISLRVLSNQGNIKFCNLLELFYRHHEPNIVAELKRSLDACSGEGVCFILDGLDEYPPEHIFDSHTSIISDIIHKKYMQCSMVIVASRPVATARLRDTANEQIEVIGFLKNQIFEYIDGYKFQDQSCTPCSLKTYLDRHRNVLHLCYLPVHTAMVCFLYEQKGDQLPSTETEIYKHFTQLTLLRKLKRETSSSNLKSVITFMEDDHIFKKICELAYNMTIHSKQVIHQDELSLSDTTGSDEPSLGLVTVDLTTKLYGFEDLYTFLHLTFQEYLAALYISRQPLKEQLKIIGKFSDKDFMRVVWKFYCGLTEFGDDVNHFNQIITGRLHDNLFKIQCAFESQQEVTCDSVLKHERDGCFSFCNCSMTALDFTAIGYVIKNAKTHPVKTLGFDRCKFGEDDVVALVKEAGSSISSIRCLHLSVIWNYLAAYAFLLNSLIFLEKINLAGTIFTSRALEHSTTLSLPKLETLILEETQCELKSLKIVRKLFGNCFKYVEILQFPVTYLRNNILKVFGLELLIRSVSQYQHVLGLQGLELDYRSIQILSADLETSLCTKLVLTNCSIDDSGAKALASGIKYATKLKNLNLSINRIKDEGAIALAGNFKYCTDLSMLDLSCNDIGDEGAIAVAEAVTSLVDLRIWNSKISESRLSRFEKKIDTETSELEDKALINGYSLIEELSEMPDALHHCKSLKITAHSKNCMQAIVKILQNCNKLQALNLLILDICSFDDSKLFLSSLKSCENLINLDLKNIRMSDDGAWAFAESLKCLMKLQKLSLGDSNFKHVGFFKPYCTQLKTLDLARNQIGNDGTRALAITLKSCVNLRSLNLSGNNICAEGAKYLAKVLFHLKMLQSLDLSNNHIGSDGIKTLADTILSLHDCNRRAVLTTLNISGNNLCSDSVGVEALATVLKHCSSYLQVLHLSDICISESGIVLLSKVLRSCTELQTLDLSGNTITNVGAKSLADSLKHCSNLQTLDLSRNSLSSEGVNSLTESIKHCIIQTLGLNGNCIDHFGARALADALQNCLSLRLGDNSIGDDGAMALSDGLKACKQLKVFDISYNGITANGIRYLANSLQECSKLELLNLGGNSIGCSGVFVLSANLKKYHGDLSTLDLKSNLIGDEGAKVLAEGLNNLQNLDLSYNFIGDDGAKALAKGLKCTYNLKKLNLSCNRINDDGAKALAESVKYISGLQELDLAGNYIAYHGAMALAGEIKHCSNLQAANLSRNDISWEGAKAFADVAIYNSNPLTLDFGFNCIYDENDNDDSCVNNLVTSLERSKNIRRLSLHDFRLGADTLASLQHCRYLQELDLACITFIDDIDTNIYHPVDCLQYCNNLQILSLCVCEYSSKVLAKYLKHHSGNLSELYLDSTNDMIKVLSDGLMYCSNLRVLHLYDCMDSFGAELDLANSLKHCRNLQKVNLSFTRVHACGAMALIDGLKCCDLQVLNFLYDHKFSSDVPPETFHGLRHYSNLRELNLNGNSIDADSAKVLADSLAHCSNLVKLDLGRNCIGTDGAKTLADGIKRCLKLEELCLSGNKVDTDGARSISDALKCFISLKNLDFGDNRIGADGAKYLADSLKHCIKLSRLDLRDNDIGSDGVKVLVDSLKQCVRLQSPQFSGNNIGSDGVRALAFCLKHHSNLWTLDLSHNRIDSNDAKVLSGDIKYCSFLKTLDLSYNQIDPNGIKALSDGIKSCCYLEDLVLGHNNIDGYGAEALSDCIKQCGYLQTLDLGHNTIDAGGATALSDGIKHFCYLYQLDLSHNIINDEGARALSDGIRNCLYLRTLNLGYNRIGADGAKALVDGIKHFFRLRSLDLSHNNIIVVDAVGAKALSDGIKYNGYLNSLNLCGNSISGEGARVLADDLKNIL